MDTLSDSEYIRYEKECGRRTKYDCKNAKVERMTSEEYAEYKKKCKKTTTKSSNDCDDVKVEELSVEEVKQRTTVILLWLQ